MATTANIALTRHTSTLSAMVLCIVVETLIWKSSSPFATVSFQASCVSRIGGMLNRVLGCGRQYVIGWSVGYVCLEKRR